MSSSKANIICLLQILWEYSDAENILSMKDIKSKMKLLYDREIDRRTVYDCMNALNQLGYDISMYEENKEGYYLRERMFDVSEVRLLMDSVYANKTIPSKHSAELIQKLQNLLNKSKRKFYKSLMICRDHAKTPNKETFYNIDMLDKAISVKKKVSFIYTEYGFDMKLHQRGNHRHIVSPYTMAIYDGSYYLICGFDNVEEPRHYHISRIKDIQLMEEKSQPMSANFHLDEYIQNAVFMYGGKPERIKMKCHRCILDQVIMRFGTDIKIVPNDNETFVATLYANPNGMYVWALQFLDTCEILQPQELRERICKVVRDSPYQ
ncbi:MAG: WYL domain-containing protein [Alistipes sp.]|nr:WYL domain-containing protein [Alistipes sp.]